MAEDLVDHRQIFDACPERVEGAAMILKAPPQFGQCSMSMSKTRLRAGPSSCASARPALERPRLRSRLRALPEREGFYCATSHWTLPLSAKQRRAFGRLME